MGLFFYEILLSLYTLFQNFMYLIYFFNIKLGFTLKLNYFLGDWGLGIGPNPQSPIIKFNPNPQSPINYIIKNLTNVKNKMNRQRYF